MRQHEADAGLTAQGGGGSVDETDAAIYLALCWQSPLAALCRVAIVFTTPYFRAMLVAAGYRMLGIKPYITFYRVVDHDIFIYCVLHGAANYPLLYEKMIHE